MIINLKKRILRIFLVIEISSLVICVVASSVYHLQKQKSKSQLFLDASRNDYLIDDKRSLNQKIQIAISSHDFKQIIFTREQIESTSLSLPNVSFSKPILAQSDDQSSVVGYAYFLFSLLPAITEAILAWILISLTFLLIIPLIQRSLEKQILTNLEMQHAKNFALMAMQVAHDIRSPLSTIRMISSIPDLNTLEARDLMNSAIVRIDEIAQDLVNIAKNNKLDGINLELINLNKLLIFLTEAKRLEFKNHDNLEINLLIPDNNIKIFTNAKELNRILSNLINNSVEAKSDKPLVIDIEVTLVKSQTHISVVDNGHGMPQLFIDKILTGKYQSTKIGQSGLGLGLKHALQAMNEMNGTLDIISQVGVGSKITLTFDSK